MRSPAKPVLGRSAFRDMLGWRRTALWVVSNDTAATTRRTHSKADGPHIGFQAETVALSVQFGCFAGNCRTSCVALYAGAGLVRLPRAIKLGKAMDNSVLRSRQSRIWGAASIALRAVAYACGAASNAVQSLSRPPATTQAPTPAPPGAPTGVAATADDGS